MQKINKQKTFNFFKRGRRTRPETTLNKKPIIIANTAFVSNNMTYRLSFL